jgi:toxin ParE1/3/4
VRTRRWLVELSEAAEADLRQITRWTRARFGEAQARRYAQTLKDALNALKDGPNTPGARSRSELGLGYMSVHTARGGKRARHIVLFRIVDRADRPGIYVVRVLHEAMDIPGHVPPQEG